MKNLSMDTIRWAINSQNAEERIAAINACKNRDDIRVHLIETGLSDATAEVRIATKSLCKTITIAPDKIERGLQNPYPDIVLATLRSVREREELTIDIIKRCLNYENNSVKMAAAESCADIIIPNDIVLTWINSGDFHKQIAAAYACKKSPEAAEKYLGLLLDLKSNKARGIALEIEGMIPRSPSPDTFTPPEKVYKKCLGDVIVIATIPKDAIVYGSEDSPCRASKANIIGIEGDFYGEEVGISIYDLSTTYRVGDRIEFDEKEFKRTYRNHGGPGFYFFCAKELAELYNL